MRELCFPSQRGEDEGGWEEVNGADIALSSV